MSAIEVVIRVVPNPDGSARLEVNSTPPQEWLPMMKILTGAMQAVVNQPPAAPVIETATPQQAAALLGNGVRT